MKYVIDTRHNSITGSLAVEKGSVRCIQLTPATLVECGCVEKKKQKNTITVKWYISQDRGRDCAKFNILPTIWKMNDASVPVMQNRAFQSGRSKAFWVGTFLVRSFVRFVKLLSFDILWASVRPRCQMVLHCFTVSFHWGRNRRGELLILQV